MLWPWLALAAWGIVMLLGVGLRGYVQWRRTGSSGFSALRGGALKSLVEVFFVVSAVAAPVSAVAVLGGWLAPFAALDRLEVHLGGVALFLIGQAGLLYAQFAMGKSWRIGVDETERTELIVGGPYRYVRNPIYSATIVVALASFLLVPNVIALGALLAFTVAVELQVRLIEEPFLLRIHGDAYRRWAGQVGRLLPGIGLLK